MPSSYEVPGSEKLQNASALLGLGLDEATNTWWIDFLCLERVVRVRPSRLWHFAYSVDDPSDDDVPCNVVDVEIKHRRMDDRELKSYGYLLDLDQVPAKWILVVSGSLFMTIICDEFMVEDRGIWDPLAAKNRRKAESASSA